MVTINTATISQNTASAATPTRITFDPPLSPEQTARLQNTSTRGQITQQPNPQNPQSGQPQTTLTLQNGEQLPVKLEPPVNLPQGQKQNITLTVKNPQEAAAQLQRPTAQPTQSTPQPTQTSLPTPTAPVPARALPNFPTPPINVPTQTTVITPPPAPTAANTFQTLTTLTPVSTPATTANIAPRVSIQPPAPLPLGTQVTVTLGTSGTATLTNLLSPATTTTPQDTVTLQNQTTSHTSPLPQITVPALPKSEAALARILIGLKALPLPTIQNTQTQTSSPEAATSTNNTFTVRIGGQLPPQTVQTLLPQNAASTPLSSNISTQTATLPSGTTTLLQSPTPLPQGTLLTLHQIAPENQPNSLVPTRLTPAPTTSNTTTQLPPPLPVSISAPTTATTTPLSLNQSFTGTITATNPSSNTATLTITNSSGQPQTITLPTLTQLPVGTQLTGTLIPSSTSTPLPATQNLLQILDITLSPQTQTTSQIISNLSTQWPTLTQAFSILNQTQPSSAEAFTATIPNLSQGAGNLAAQLTSFAEAATTADPKKMLSDDLVNLLRNLGIDLTPDLQNLQNLTKNDTPESWRGFLFPYIENDPENPHQGGMYYRQQDDEDGTTQTRFFVNLSLTHLGDLNLDGLYKPAAQNSPDHNQLNLRLHTTIPWPDDMQTALTTFVQQTMENMSLSGSFSITSSPPQDNPSQSISNA